MLINYGISLFAAASLAPPRKTSIHTVTRTAGPRLIDRQGSTTTYPYTVHGCVPTQGTDVVGKGGCGCDNWEGVLPFTDNEADCDYSVLSSYIPPPTTTNTFDTYASFPYTVTKPNRAVVAYATTTTVADAGPWQQWTGAGASTTIQAGMSMSIHADTKGVQVGTLTGDELYTSISNAIASACPSPDGTVTSCEEAKVTDILWSNGHNLQTDGELTINLDVASYHDPDVLQGFIQSISRTVASAPNKTSENYCWASNIPGIDDDDQCDDGVNWPTVDLVSVPNTVQAVFTEQDSNTGGKVDVQFLQAAMTFQEPKSPLLCSFGALVMDSLALFTADPAVAIGAAAMSFTCAMRDRDELGSAE